MAHMLEKIESPSTDNGMTLDELRYRRALIYMKSEMLKEQIVAESSGTFSGLGNITCGGGLLNKMMTGMDYLQYAVSGYRMFKKISKIFKSGN
ncbi:MAG: hypothetical protein K2M94_02695 [Paramuribaculum sp.]|nr:hypothetical protein [Paramuribaculum sp.]